MNDLNEEQRHQALFITLVQQYQMQAWISLGKLKNPATDKIERNIEMARLSIDMLDMIQTKTQGNLNAEEKKLLNQTINDLKLSFVEESKSESHSQSSEEKSENS
jgi:hypothetical protein